MTRARLAPLLAPCVLLLAWFAASRTPWAARRAVPSPRDVAVLARGEFATSTLWLDLGATVARLAVGVGLAVLLGVALGFVLGWACGTWRAAEPTVDFLRSIPPILTYPLFLLALGYGEASRIAAVVFGCSGILVLQIATALAQAPAARADAVRLAGIRGFAALRTLYAYEALPALITGVRLAITSGLIVVVVSEMLVGARYGLGSRAEAALLEYRSDLLWLVIVAAGALNFAVSSALVAVERRVVHWAGK